MLAQPTVLLSIPINSPFPVTLVLSAAATAAFGVELVIAKKRVHPSRWMYILLACCLILGAVLITWSGYYAVYGPAAADTRMPTLHDGIRFPSIPNPWYPFYRAVWLMNIALGLSALILVLVSAILLRRHRG